MRNRQMIVRWLMANTKAIEERTRDGKRYLVMVDPMAFREGVGRLLAEVQRIKSEGDYAAAAKLFDTYGDPLRPEAARRGRHARRRAEPAVLHRVRDAEADAGDRRERQDHRRDDLLPDGSDDADARVVRRSRPTRARRERASPSVHNLADAGSGAIPFSSPVRARKNRNRSGRREADCTDTNQARAAKNRVRTDTATQRSLPPSIFRPRRYQLGDQKRHCPAAPRRNRELFVERADLGGLERREDHAGKTRTRTLTSVAATLDSSVPVDRRALDRQGTRAPSCTPTRRRDRPSPAPNIDPKSVCVAR